MSRNPFHGSSSELMESVLNNASTSIIVCSTESRVLLYVNECIHKLFLKEDYRPGTTCYEAAGRCRPCPSCQYEEPNSSEFTVCSYMDPVTQRIYQVGSKMIDQEETWAHIEHIVGVIGTQIKMERYRSRSEGPDRILYSAPYGLCTYPDDCVHLETELKNTRMKMKHLVNSIPGGIASYEVREEKAVPDLVSDGLFALSEHTRSGYNELVKGDTIDTIYEAGRGRTLSAARSTVEDGRVTDTSCRTRCKDGHLVWIHISGRRIGPEADMMRFYAVFTGVSKDAILFRSTANDTAECAYVTDKESYESIYTGESAGFLCQGADCIGQKCYAALCGKNQSYEFCTLKSHKSDDAVHDMDYHESGRFYSIRLQKTLWNDIPAYLKHMQDVAEEVEAQKEKEHIEQYFQALVRKLPEGVAVARIEGDKRETLEYFSDGYAILSGISVDQVWESYGEDDMIAVRPDDVGQLNAELSDFMTSGEKQWEFTYRIKRGDGEYIWVRNMTSMFRRGEGEVILYVSYRDLTVEFKEQEQIRRQYRELILQHYRILGPDTSIVKHCNTTKSRVTEISDCTDSDLLERFGTERNTFFAGISTSILDEKERQDYMNRLLNEPIRAAFQTDKREPELDCLIRLPKDVRDCHVKFKINLVEEPNTGDIIGILTVYDITEQTIIERNLRRLSTSGYDLIADMDPLHDFCMILSGRFTKGDLCTKSGRHSERLTYMMERQLVPRDRS